MPTPIRNVDIPPGTNEKLCGELVIRGAIGSRATLEVTGDVKLGWITEVCDDAHIRCFEEGSRSGGSIAVAERFRMPPAVTLHADRAVYFEGQNLPNQGIFDTIRIYGARIDLESGPPLIGKKMVLAPDPESILVGEGTPSISSGTTLKLSVAYGPNIQLGLFARIEARSLQHFSHLRGCGIITGELVAIHLSESTVRATRVSVGNGGGTLAFFPQSTSLREPPTFRHMFAPEGENYANLINDLMSRPGVMDLFEQGQKRKSLLYSEELEAEVFSGADAGGSSAPVSDLPYEDSATGDVDDHEQSAIDQFLMDANSSSQARPPAGDHLRELYERLVEIVMLGEFPFSETDVSIGVLNSTRSFDNTFGNAHTKVYVHNGNLSIGRLAEKGVAVHVPCGEVTITEGTFPLPGTEELEDVDSGGYSSVRAFRINLSTTFAFHPAIERIKWYGKVFVDGVRVRSLESR